MLTTVFTDIPTFVRAPRVTALSASRSGQVVVTRRTIGEDGSTFVDQLFAVTPESVRQLTNGPKSASLLAVGERGEVYFRRSDPGSDEKGDAIWMLPPAGEAREIFRYKGGIKALEATQTHLFLSLTVMPDKQSNLEDPDLLLGASHDYVSERKKNQVSAVLHRRFPTRYWDSDLGPGQTQLFVSPLPDLYPEPDLGPAHPGLSLDGEQAESLRKDDAEGGGLPPHELQLQRVTLPPQPTGSHQWELSAVVPVPGGTRVLAEMSVRRNITSRSEVWMLDFAQSLEPELVAADVEDSYSVADVAPSGTWVLLHRSSPPVAGRPVHEVLESTVLGSDLRKEMSEHEMTRVVISADEQIYFTADRFGRGGIYRLGTDGSPTLLTPDNQMTFSDLACAGDSLVALVSSVARAPEPAFIDPTTGLVDALNMVADMDLPGHLTEITAEGVDGTPLRAWLALPEDPGPHPLLVFAHGGPWGSWNDWTWRWNPWVFVARGYAVLLPDPGISTGYGPHLAHRGHDSIGDEPFTDIMALTDAAVAREDIDADHQLFAGGSYGGYMANWVAGHTGGRFKRIVTHASLWNIESMARTTDNGSWHEWMMTPVPGGSGNGQPQAELWSPHRFVDQIQVPMLVIHGADDHRVPVSQGLELWMDLQRTSPELDHQYLYYPDEGHWILKPGNAEAWYQTFLDFLAQAEEAEAEQMG